MFRIPLGEIFEAFINWLTDSFSVFFDAVSAVLNFAIEALENILLLSHAEVYPSAILVALGAWLTYLLCSRYKPSMKVVAAVAAGVVLLAAEGWRYSQLEYKIDSDRGAGLAERLDSLSGAIKAASPGDYGLGLEAVAAVEATFTDRAPRAVRSAEGDLEDLRPRRFDDAEDALLEIEEGALEGDYELPVDAMNELQEVILVYRALSFQEDLDRLSEDLRELSEPERRAGMLNERAYDRMTNRMEAVLGLEADWAQDAAFTAAATDVRGLLKGFDPQRLSWYPWLVLIILFVILALMSAGKGLAVFTGIGFLVIVSMGFWEATMESLALVLSATLFALLIGIPVGIAAARNNVVDNVSRPILDFMQTMPAFVYLIPAVLFFGLGKVPGAMATLIFAMPPAVRLTSLGIRQVPTEVVEACLAFGATPKQLLYKAQLPIARPTILAGLNQTIMLALSMVVIGGMIGAGGLGQEVLSGITQLKIGLGFESGISVVILAIFLDRVTQSFGGGSSK